jgi:hypothetical protein
LPEEWLAVRTAKSGKLVQANDLATVTVFPSVGFPSMIGASAATYARVSSGSARPVARWRS